MVIGTTHMNKQKSWTRLVNVGDLVYYDAPIHDDMESHSSAMGIVLKLSETGHATKSAQVLFTGGEIAWFDTQVLRVAHESR